MSQDTSVLQRKKQILFVDDEPSVLQGIGRMLRGMRNQWDMDFAESGQAALDLLEASPADVIVSDMRMPGMDGAQLFQQVKERHPYVVRIILSGQSEQEKILRSINPTHRYLSKPCDPQVLKQTIESAFALRQTLEAPALIRVVSKLETVPSVPDLYEEIMKEMERPEASLQRIGQILSRDMGMTAKILKVVNSAFFGNHPPVSNPEQAVTLLGVDIVKALILNAHVFSAFAWEQLKQFSIDHLWNHSTTVGSFARMIAVEETSDPWIIEDASSAGLLHDLGKVVLAANLPTQYEDVLTLARKENIQDWEAEQHVFGASHMEVGAFLLGLWGLPESIVEALAFHHRPGKSGQRQFSPLTAVHVADVLEKTEGTEGAGAGEPRLDWEYLNTLGLADRISKWKGA